MFTGDCWRGISKNEGAFKDLSGEWRPGRVLSNCIGSGVRSRLCGFDLGEGCSCVSVLTGFRSGFRRICALGVDAKYERLPWLRLKPCFSSVCLLKASNSGFASMAICLGEDAPKDRIDDEGGLQLSFGPAPESRGSVAGSTISPK
jgi:hypothetical protein